ncbi:conserved hypothetical protein [uncultured Eubacteriales bacterium]|uniref:Uncharacterized protein n=1 Tax=uncultured Eubacteriales bacterium TaxID=172733 RepID=A0A212K310_9FIRM|nr:conserved hypothetical protein [uncultured Eubacteriales bacterium]
MMADYFDRFSVLFGKGEVFVNGKPLPLGQCATDILNLNDQVLNEINQRINAFMPSIATLLQEKTDSAACSAQEKLNAVWDLIFTMPLYRELSMDLETSHQLLQLMFSDRAKWDEVLDIHSEGHAMFEQFLNGLEYFPESLRNFRGQVVGILELYLEPLNRRSIDAYAAAYARYFTDMAAAGIFFAESEFEQSFPTQVKFVPIAHPTMDGKVILAEKAEFSYLSHFLYTDFYRGLMAGNTPRRCHNCGKYFLLTEGYNTCYCNNLAPGETERTCRKVGAHRKEAKERASATPAQREYAKAYNRLKARKNRKRMNLDEWNAAVAKAQDLKGQAERGEISNEELRRRLQEL